MGRDMARILYSCCGEGQGHSSRVLTITRALTWLGHEVKILASHKAFKVLQTRLPDVQQIPGFTFVYHNNRVELLASFWANLPLVRQRRGVIREIVKLIEDWQPHLAITDFEPFLPRAAELTHLRCISLDHQGVIPFARPALSLDQLVSAQAARSVVWLTDYHTEAHFATSFYYPPLPPGTNVEFFPPILRQKVLDIARAMTVMWWSIRPAARLPGCRNCSTNCRFTSRCSRMKNATAGTVTSVIIRERTSDSSRKLAARLGC